ncbi:uncharacterized protein LOC106133971 [Amyelois transitella]|uniref:uncharacterized protein LOC106133971 n=1 Tax=Amyelois transitella TaxID=680683 RepID=UPI0029904A07|nr:uncharacterized protein LOC106133971 [Amyelois transitella]
MNKNEKGGSVGPSPGLTLIGVLSGGLTIVLSVVYITLYSLAVHVRNNCDAGITSQSGPGSTFFINILLQLYFKQDDCPHALLLNLDITQEHTVFVMACLSLTVSILCLLLAIGFIAALKTESALKYIEPLGYCYIVSIILSIAIDLAATIHFGMDYNTFTENMNNSSPGVSINYVRDMYRLGALLLMLVSAKGFLAPVFNIIFISLLIFYLVEFRQKIQSEEHSIHKVGALRAYDQPRRIDEQSENSFQQFRAQPKRNDDPWQNGSESTYAPYRGPQVNPMFVNDEDHSRMPSREPPRSEYTNPSYERYPSHHNHQPSLASRPFSYLEDIKRQPALKSPSPTREPQWPRDPWDAQAPPVPAPDYSPETPRRLKSALKSSFM